MLKTPVLHQYVAHVDVNVLKFNKQTFNLILDQFQDFKEDLQEASADRKDNKKNDKFIYETINSEEARKIIIKNYNLIIK